MFENCCLKRKNKIPKNFVILIIKLPLFTKESVIEKPISMGLKKMSMISDSTVITNLANFNKLTKRNIPMTSFEDSLIILKKVASTLPNFRKGQYKQQIENLTKLILKENKPKILKEYINYMTKINRGLFFILKKYPFLSVK